MTASRHMVGGSLARPIQACLPTRRGRPSQCFADAPADPALEIARRGQEFEISASGQTITLGK